MTVQELRDALAAQPDDLRVMVRGYEGGLEDLTADQVKTITAHLDVHSEDSTVYGQHERVGSLTSPKPSALQDCPVVPALLLDRRKTEYRDDDD